MLLLLGLPHFNTTNCKEVKARSSLTKELLSGNASVRSLLVVPDLEHSKGASYGDRNNDSDTFFITIPITWQVLRSSRIFIHFSLYRYLVLCPRGWLVSRSGSARRAVWALRRALGSNIFYTVDEILRR